MLGPRWRAAALALLCAPAGVAAAPQPPRIVYGGDESAGPYEGLDGAGQPRGFNVDLVRALGQSRGFTVEFRFGPWAQILRALDAGEVDLVSMAYTDERARRYDMLAEVWTLRQAVFFPERRADPPRGLDQLGAETIAVPEGLYMHDFLAALPEAQRPLLRASAGSVEQVELLRRGAVTAVAGNALLLNAAAARAGLRGLHEVPVKALSYQLVTRKGRRAEFDWIAPGLDALRASGEHTRFVERHLTAEVSPRSSWRDYLLPAAVAAGALGLAFAAAAAWNRSLRSQVQSRTRELKQSLSLLQSALESSRSAEAEVRRSERMAAMGTLVAGVAHEVRNPLFNLTSTLDVFEARLPPRPEDRRYLDTLRRELNRLAALMRELLDYGRPPELSLRSGEVEDALKEAVGFSESLAALAQVRLRLDQDGRLAPVLMDRPRLVQAFQNLIQNAVQHSPAGGEVVIEARRDGDAGYVTCSVRDSGAGFQPEDLPHVFEPFFTRRRGGTGLGLSLVQRIVEQHGGSVVAANHPQGGGVTTVRLPETRRG
jgi:signal transduction histidine kinase